MAAGQPPLVDRPPPLTAKDIFLRGIQSQPSSSTSHTAPPAWAAYISPPPTTYKGEICIPIPSQGHEILSSRFQFALVGKFPYGRPSMDKLKREIQTIGFKGEVHVALMNHRHVLMRFDIEEDYHRCWLKSIWFLGGFSMRFLKWTPTFKIDEEPSVVPIWISLPMFPIHLCTENVLKGIGDALGGFLKTDIATILINRPSVARICVELDLLKELSGRVWVGVGYEGFWQELAYDHLPEYCMNCKKIGHAALDCRSGARIQHKLALSSNKRPSQSNTRSEWRVTKDKNGEKGVEGTGLSCSQKDQEAAAQHDSLPPVKNVQDVQERSQIVQELPHVDKETPQFRRIKIIKNNLQSSIWIILPSLSHRCLALRVCRKRLFKKRPHRSFLWWYISRGFQIILPPLIMISHRSFMVTMAT